MAGQLTYIKVKSGETVTITPKTVKYYGDGEYGPQLVLIEGNKALRVSANYLPKLVEAGILVQNGTWEDSGNPKLRATGKTLQYTKGGEGKSPVFASAGVGSSGPARATGGNTSAPVSGVTLDVVLETYGKIVANVATLSENEPAEVQAARAATLMIAVEKQGAWDAGAVAAAAKREAEDAKAKAKEKARQGLDEFPEALEDEDDDLPF